MQKTLVKYQLRHHWKFLPNARRRDLAEKLLRALRSHSQSRPRESPFRELSWNPPCLPTCHPGGVLQKFHFCGVYQLREPLRRLHRKILLNHGCQSHFRQSQNYLLEGLLNPLRK